MTYLNMSPTLK